MFFNRTPCTALCVLACLLSGCGKSQSEPQDNNSQVSTQQENTQAIEPELVVEEPSATETPAEQAPEQNSEAMTIELQAPGIDASNIALTSKIVIGFDQDVLDASYSSSLLRLQMNNSPVAGVFKYVGNGRFEFTPNTLLHPSTQYRVVVSDEVMSVNGAKPAPTQWTFTTVADVFTTPQAVIDLCMSPLDIEMLASVNAARVVARNCGDDAMPAVSKLKWNCTIQQAAIIHSEDMSNNDFFSHTGSDGSSVGDRLTRAGYIWGYAGENLAAGQRSVSEAMAGLLDSPGHCLNIMRAEYTEFGFGYSVNDNTVYKRYWTQNYGKPRSL